MLEVYDKNYIFNFLMSNCFFCLIVDRLLMVGEPADVVKSKDNKDKHFIKTLTAWKQEADGVTY